MVFCMIKRVYHKQLRVLCECIIKTLILYCCYKMCSTRKARKVIQNILYKKINLLHVGTLRATFTKL